MKQLVLLLLLAVPVFSALFAQPEPVQTDSLLREIPHWMADNHVPCVGLGIVRDGRIVWLKNFGELKTGHPAPSDALFNIASQTKPVTAMLVLKLVQAGLWSLDAPLARDWVDPDIAGNPYLEKLSTRFVLSHQTGFPNWRTDNDSSRLYFKFEPGKGFGYSGEGFEYLRHALENHFHQSLATLMQTYLFGPAGLKHTGYWSGGIDSNRFAMWHDGKGNRYPYPVKTSVSAADDLITTPEDYCNLGIYVMNGLGLPDSLFRQMISPQVITKPGYGRGLGWGVVQGLPGGGYALEHGGSDIGVRTMAVFLPKTKSGVVVMTNGDNGMFVSDHIIKEALAEGGQVLAIMNQGTAKHDRVAIPDAAIVRHTGEYVQSNGKIILIEKQGNAIRVSGDGAPTAVLFPESETSFFLDGYDVQLQFPDDQTLVIFEGGKQVMKIKRRQP